VEQAFMPALKQSKNPSLRRRPARSEAERRHSRRAMEEHVAFCIEAMKAIRVELGLATG
jgi:hypothetical protein